MPQFDLKRAKIYAVTGDNEEVLIQVGEGTITYSEKRNVDYTLDGGKLDEVREGDEVPIDVKLDFTWKYLRSQNTSGATPSVEEVLKGLNGITSSDADNCRPYAVDLKIVFAPNPKSCGDAEIINLLDFRWESFDHDAKAGAVSVGGKCNVTQATVIRAEQLNIHLLAFGHFDGNTGYMYNDPTNLFVDFEILDATGVRDTTQTGIMTISCTTGTWLSGTGLTISGDGHSISFPLVAGHFRCTNGRHTDAGGNHEYVISYPDASSVTVSRMVGDQ